MTTKIKVPELGESVVEATVGRWEKSVGDQVAIGDVLVSLETDKVDIDVGADTAGVLTSIEAEEGTDVKIGDTLGLLDSDGAAQKEDKSASAESEPDQQEDTTRSESDSAHQQESEQASTSEKVTPVARRMADEKGVDLSQVSGSGSGGRITKQDVEDYTQEMAQEEEAEKEAPKPVSSSTPPPTSDRAGREERQRMSRRRRTIARRLVEAQQNAAMLTTFNEIDMSAVINMRKRRQDNFVKRHEVKLGFMSFFVKASIGALKAFPQLNAEIDGDEIVLKHYYDIGMAIGAEEGLVVPVIRDADQMTFAEIEQTIQDYVTKTREGSLSLEDLRGGTFTITNGGVFGSLLSTPILNPPQVGILGLHKFEDRPVAFHGEVVIRPMMYVALSYDHRIVDGREAVQFLVRLKELIEDPEALLLEG